MKQCIRCKDYVEEDRFDDESDICIDCKYEMIEVMELADSNNQ